MNRLKELTRTSFKADDYNNQLANVLTRSCVFGVATVLLVWILQPDLFGLVPNSLDPMFYTGYAINLDDVLNAAENRHYFVTRWTSYMPMYVFSEIFGPYWGRLVLRLVMILVLSEMLWRFGQRIGFPTRSRFLGIFVVTTAPMFVRAFTTDYPEYLIIWASMCIGLLFVFFAEKPSVTKCVLIGLLSSAIVIANPFTILLVSISLSLGAILIKVSGVSWRWTVLGLFIAWLAAIGLIFFGYVLFKSGYQIGNPYQPTFNFMREYVRPAQDGWVAPFKDVWLKHFSWLYLSPLVIIFSLIISKQTKVSNKRAAIYFGSVGLMLFLAHIYVEIQRGNALETSYYWSMSLGPILIILYLISGQLSRGSSARWSFISGIALCGLIIWRIPQQIQLPAGTSLFICLAILALILIVIHIQQSKISPIFFLVIALWLQTGAPTYSQRSYGGDLNSPRYDLVYRAPQNQSHLVLDETLWFLGQMDEIPDDWRSTFLSAGGWSASIVGTYIPHPFSRWVVPASEETVFAPNVRDELEFGYRSTLVIYGDPGEVEILKKKVESELSNIRQVKDATHGKGLGYRLVVLTGDESESGTALIPMSRLDRQIGKAKKDGSVMVKGGLSQGFVSFGPYFGLGEGFYTATLEYTSENQEEIGYFEVYNDVTQESKLTTITSAGDGKQKIIIEFDVENLEATWQLRTVYTGKSDVTFHRILLKKTRKS